MHFTFSLADRRLRLLRNGAEEESRALADADINAFKGWAAAYGAIVRADRGERSTSLEPLLALGREIGAWLDQTRWMAALTEGGGPLHLDIAVGDSRADEARALLDVPWELLATTQGFLALDAARPFCVQRRIGRAQGPSPAKPRFQSLKLMFMAASPRAVQPVLNYEAEEASILNATEGLPLALTVEESGCLQFLEQRLAAEAPFEAVHLSCHGDIIDGEPKLILESPEGDRADASAADIVSAFGAEKPGLVFLAACRTAEHEAQSAPLAMELLRSGVPTVLGWDGSVLDTDATDFARTFYTALAQHGAPAFAAAQARRALLAAHQADPERKTCRHWHMARLYASADGGGPLCNPTVEARPSQRGAAYNAFLDKERARVPVAGPMAFVGRRREAQRILGVFRNRSHPGVLIHAIGGQGKSSLAARVADRMPRHKTAVVFGAYRAEAIFNAVLTAVPPEERGDMRDRWEKKISDKDAPQDVLQNALRDALEDILTGPCAAFDAGKERQPLLLVIDDLERTLETPAPGVDATHVQTEFRAPLCAVIEAFDRAIRANSQSRLILTSRYDFTLPNRDGLDLAGLLHKLPLRPFDDYEQGKQQRAARTELGGAVSASLKPEQRDALLARAREAALGNPLIQATLTRLALAEPAAAEPAIREMEDYIKRGETRDHAALGKLFERLTLDAYRKALNAEEKAAFRAMTLFAIPVPEAALVAAAEEAAPGKAKAAFDRFLRLGLLDPFEAAPPAKIELIASKLARPLFDTLTEEEQRHLAKTALPALVAAWTDEDEDLPFDTRALEVWRLAGLAGDGEIMAKAALCGGAWLYGGMHDARTTITLIQPALDLLAAAQLDPDPLLLKLAIECAGLLGESDLQDEWLRHSANLKGGDAVVNAILLGQNAERLMRLGNFDEALTLLGQVENTFAEANDEHNLALAKSRIADILVARGDMDEALRIRREEELPVYERLGDVHSRAVTMGQIADILYARGDLDEALRIHREEQLPVYERRGDVRERAVTMGKIADILAHRGELDEALRLFEEERLPVAKQLGDIVGIGMVLVKTSRIRMAKGIGDQETAQRVFDDLSLAYTLAKKLDRLEAICAVAEELGLLLAAFGHHKSARPLLAEARDGNVKLGQMQAAARVEALLAQLPGPSETGG